MKNNHENREIEWLKSFRISDSNDISFDLYKNFSESEESLKNFWETFSDFYYISCAPFKKSIEQWKDIPEIYEILKRSIHMANGFLGGSTWRANEEIINDIKKMFPDKIKTIK